MKHFFCFIVAVISFVTEAFASHPSYAADVEIAQDIPEYVQFSYSETPRGYGGYSEDSYKGGAMLITDYVAARFDKCKITEVEIANGRFFDQDQVPVRIFFTHSLNETPFYCFSDFMDIEKPLQYKTYALPEPVEISSGEPFFVGYSVFAPKAVAPKYEVNCPVITDAVYHTDFPGGYIGFSLNTGEPEQMDWNDEGYAGGQVCIRLKIEGENLPQNTVELKSVTLHECVTPEITNNADVAICNLGVNKISDVDIAYKVLDQTVSKHIEFSNPLEYNQSIWTSIEFSVPEEGANVPVSFTIEKVNGHTPSTTAVTGREVTIHSLYPDNGFAHNMLVEEAGGRGCGWCVRGIVGIDRMMKAHNDGTFIPISAHHIGYGEDTAPYNYEPFWERYITHNPSCLINRSISRIGVTDPNSYNLAWYYDDITNTPAIAAIEVKEYTLEDDWLSVNSDVTFALPEENGVYSVAYVVTEDKVGPYVQNNAYAGDTNSAMDGWENLGEHVVTYYDFLARGISNFDGTPLAVPAKIEPGDKYNHSDKVSMVKVSDMSNLSLVAMVINDKTGWIENSCRVAVEDLAAIQGVMIDSDTYPVEYFDLSGRKLSGCPSSGIYIRRQGAHSEKIVVQY